MKYEEEYIKGEDGRYRFNGSHSDDFMRYAPATVCQIMGRIDNIRKLLKEDNVNLKRLEHEVRHIPYEEEFKSAVAIRLKSAIIEFEGDDYIGVDQE